MSSHGAGFFSELLSGRVWVALSLVPTASAGAGPWAAHFGADGVLRRCGSGGEASAAGWDVVPSVRHRAVLVFRDPETAAAGGSGRRGSLFYDAASGRLHAEIWLAGGDRALWVPWAAGWVQEGWPRSMADRCPELVSGDVPVNERQTETSWKALKDQDPGAPLRMFDGAELRGPGAAGRGWMRAVARLAAGSGPSAAHRLAWRYAPTLPAGELKRFLSDRDGEVLVHNDGSRHVLVLRAAGDELWRLAPDGSVEDVGHLSLGGDQIVLQYERSDREERWAVDFALPLLPTGERYAAMRLGDWLASRADPVVLPFNGVERVGFRFAGDGTAAASTVDGGRVDAAWQWSRGSLLIRVRGVVQAASYPWQRLAAHVGWPEASGR